MGRRELMVWLGMPHVNWSKMFELVDGLGVIDVLVRLLFCGAALNAVFEQGWYGFGMVSLFGFIMFFCGFGVLLAIRKWAGYMPGLWVLPNPISAVFLWWFCIWTKGGTDLLVLIWRPSKDAGTRLPQPTDQILSYG